jgi:hypothetical protein
MPRVLRNLQIREILSVSKGAGEGCEIVLMKRHDAEETETLLGQRLRKIFAKAFPTQYRPYRYAGIFKNAEDEDDGDRERRNEDRLQDREDATQEDDIIVTGEDANEISERRKDDSPMSRIEKLQAIAKQHGVATIAKGMLTDGDARGVSEFEFTEMMMAEATRKGVSFEKYFGDPANLDIRHAHALTKNVRVAKDTLLRPVEVQPMVTEVGDTSEEDDSAEALAKLQEMARQLYDAGKYRSVDAAFLAVFQDSRNAELTSRAHRRPAPTTSYAFPR